MDPDGDHEEAVVPQPPHDVVENAVCSSEVMEDATAPVTATSPFVPLGLLKIDAPYRLPVTTTHDGLQKSVPSAEGLLMIATQQTKRAVTKDSSKAQLQLEDVEQTESERVGFCSVTNFASPRKGREDDDLDSSKELEDDDDFFWEQPTRSVFADEVLGPIAHNSEEDLNEAKEPGASSTKIPAEPENEVSVQTNLQETQVTTSTEKETEAFEDWSNDDLFYYPRVTKQVEASRPMPFQTGNEIESDEHDGGMTTEVDGGMFKMDDLRDSLNGIEAGGSSVVRTLAAPLFIETDQQVYGSDSEDELLDIHHAVGTADYTCDTSDITDTTDDTGDLTEVTPMSSLAPSPMPLLDEAAGSSGEAAEPPALAFCKAKLAENWLENMEEKQHHPEVTNQLNPGLPTFSFDSGMEDNGSPIPPKAESGHSSESGRGSFSSRCGIDFSQNELVPNKKLSPETREFFRNQKAANKPRSPRRPGGSGILNKSFPPNEARRIERNNQILLGKLVETAQQRRQPSGCAPTRSTSSGRAKHVASSSIFRKKHTRRIDLENEILLKRIRSAKASKEITANFSGKDKKKS